MRKKYIKIALSAFILCAVTALVLLLLLPRTFAVRFDLNYEDAEVSAPATQRVKRGDYAVEPEPPVRENYVFVGWFTEKQPEYLSGAYAFESTPVTEKLTLYAVWRVDAGIFAVFNTATASDSDGDGLSDEYEDRMGTDKLKADTDGDGVDDYTEIVYLNTDPCVADSDGNGRSDGEEDFDGDGLTNAEEQDLGTQPLLADTDNDGVLDGEEVFLGLDLLDPDTDGDGASDGYEIANGTDPAAVNESFTESAWASADGEKGIIAVSVDATVTGDIAGTVSARALSLLEFPAMSKTISGYMGSAFELSADGPIDRAQLTFEYDLAFGKLGDDFQPRIYYYNEKTHEYEELPDQTVEEGRITVGIEHFSYYAILNSAELDSYSGLPEKYAPKDKSSTRLEDYYDAIYYGLMPTTDGQHPFVGFDLKSNSDFDGDGLKNSEELEIVFNKKGLPVVYVNSDPVLPDTDFDGIDDAEDDFPLEYSLRSADDIRALLDDLKYASTEVYYDLYYGGDSIGEQILGGMKRNLNEVYSALGYLDYGSQSQVFLNTWLEYLSLFCDFAVEQTYELEMQAVNAGFWKEYVDYLRNKAYRLAQAYDVNGDVTDFAKVLAENLPKHKLVTKATDFTTGLADEVMDVFPAQVKKFASNGVATALVGFGFDVVSSTIETQEIRNQAKAVAEKIAENNANVEAYASCIAILDNIIAYNVDPAATSAALQLKNALSDSANTCNALYDSLVQAENYRYALKIAYDAISLLNYTSVGKCIQFVMEKSTEVMTGVANLQNKVIANAMMACSAQKLVSSMIVDVDQGIKLKNADNAQQVYSLLGHLWGLRLNGDRYYAELWGRQKYLGIVAAAMNKRAENIGLAKSEDLLQLCYQISEPNMVISVITHEGLHVLGAKNYEYAVFVDGVQLIYVDRDENELKLYLEPGTSHKVKIVVLGNDGVYYTKEQSLISQSGKVLRGEFVINMNANSFIKYKVIDKHTKDPVDAVLILRFGKNNTADTDFMHTVFNASKRFTEFEGIDIPAGEYCVEIIANGYSSYYNNITAEEKKTGKLVFELTRLENAPVQGKVKGFDGKMLEGARVELVDVNGEILASTVSAADGSFAFNVPLDKLASYYAVCTAEGYKVCKTKVYSNIDGTAFENTIVMDPVIPPSEVIAEGEVKSDIKWYLLGDGTLSVFGSGYMPYYGRNGAKDQPWAEYFDSIRKVIVGEGIIGLGDYSFAHCRNLREVVLPSTLQHLGNGTFAFCISLSELVVPDSVTEMGWDVFYACTRLKNVKLSSNLKTLGANAFYGCSSLRALTVPASVRLVNVKCFYGCRALSTVHFMGKAPEIEASAFEGVRDRAVLYYISGMTGWTAPRWECKGVTYRTAPYAPALPTDGSMLGSGTADDPYQVCTAQQLDAVRNNLKAHYLQMNDIDLSGFENFIPIGKGVPGGATTGKTKNYDYGGAWFEGTYDGNGFKISGLRICQTELDCVGLFSGASKNAVLRNINIENAYIEVDKASTDYYAFFEKYEMEFYTSAGVLVGACYGNIENCTVSGELKVLNGCTVLAGGIAGVSDSITKCDNYASIYVMANRNARFSNVAGDVTCGGIVGQTITVYGSTIKHCRNFGSVTATAGSSIQVSGISAHLGYLLECINYGDITARYDLETGTWKTDVKAGGISGELQNANVTGCINVGNVKAQCYVSGSDANQSNNFVVQLGGIAGHAGFLGDGKVVSCLNGCDEISCEIIDKIDVNGNVTEYKLSSNIYRITELHPYSKSQFTNNYSLATTLVNGEAVTEGKEENGFNGGDISEEEFDRRLAELVALIEGR